MSVVIPVRDEEASIGALLESLWAQTRPPDEVIVVDGGSTDRTPEIVREAAQAGRPLRLIRVARAYPGEGRNLGVQAARNEWIAFTDAGIRLDPHWLEKLCEPLEVAQASLPVQSPYPDIVYGSYEPVTDTFFKECAALAYVPAPVKREGGWLRGPSTASCLVNRAAWAVAGGFPPHRAAEDLMFMEALQRAGCRTAWAPEAVVSWQPAAGWRATFWRFAVYSYHNLEAGRGRYWHWGVARQYGAVAPFAALAALHHPLWWGVPAAWLAARAGKTLWSKRRGFRIKRPLSPPRWAMVAALLLWIDAAALAGSLGWGWKRLWTALHSATVAEEWK